MDQKLVEYQAAWTRNEDIFLGSGGRVLRGIHNNPKDFT